ncbi:PTS system mannitol-specific transporter subunit IIC [Corynebacterium suranareeae]|uniref:Mannitol-specific phosphotransferase enzyme IIA component n=1 Tax=Corynebacterium suranareeae TaxID=2506452 RepID=A0A169S125_9CORY|nr:PTS mannitol transporter subunit IICBA [Corynebacterium suranareeae]BAU96598.1 PTS system mannitol-specific transporter subunit IIC [Corynebacterium suranareeae]
MSTITEAQPQKGGARVAVQKFGTFLSSMIMPNIGAFIAWGLITALFIPDGFFPNEKIGSLVGPMVTYLLPILIAYTGGRLIYDTRGGVVGAIATMGVILGTSSPVFIGEDGSGSPMFLGAMICGPLFAWLMKKIDGLWAGKIKPGFEMLVDNFSAGIFAAIGAVASMFLLTPVMNIFMELAGAAVEFLIRNNLLFLTSVLIEPAKVLFLNNAINHGVLTPLAADQAVETGKSVLYLLEANPGPGLGILLAYIFFGSGAARATAPGAAIIHFFGGIHEIYFPYVLMKPALLVAAIGGGMTGVFINTIMGAGLRSPAAPGSIIAVYASTASDSYLAVTCGVAGAAIVSFVIAGAILKFSKQSEEDIAEATAKMEAMKGKKSSVAGALTANAADAPQINKIVFACDAGMGSSAMGASVLRNKIKDAGFAGDIVVTNSAINNLKDEYDLLVVHEDLLNRAKQPTPSAVHVAVDNFMASPRYDEIVDMIREQRTGGSANADTPSAAVPAAAGATAVATAPAATATEETADAESNKILTVDNIVLGGKATDRDASIDEAGQILVAAGAVDQAYVDAMHEREKSVSTFMGNGLAIPHGTNEAKDAIHGSAISFIRYDEPIDWGGKPAKFVVGIAGADGSHLGLLSKIAKIFGNKQSVAQLEQATTAEEVLEIFGKVNS